jgi:hypothetical protein
VNAQDPKSHSPSTPETGATDAFGVNSDTRGDGAGPISRAWYEDSLDRFRSATTEMVLGCLVSKGNAEVVTEQRNAWAYQIEFLRTALAGLPGDSRLLLEFNIPRMGRRIDAVLLTGPAVFVLEFKVGEALFESSAIEQVWDYALDLKNFHEPSHPLPIVPILVATEAEADAEEASLLRPAKDGVFVPLAVGAPAFRSTLDLLLRHLQGTRIDTQAWAGGRYRPTPTIIEAARALYAQHSVEAIARYDAGAINLRVTSNRLDQLVDDAIAHRRKVICLVTGVPGAGKTLVGLNLATRHRRELHQPTSAVFLSGNGPLVAVLREALVRDEVQRSRAQGRRLKKVVAQGKVKAFIQNVHHFRDDCLEDPGPPAEHVAIFDEAQRAWDLNQTSAFMKRKKNRAGFSQSEPDFLLSCMDRHSDWAVVVCLVGGGQEINTGEAGIGTWIEAIRTRFPEWHLHISSRLGSSEYAAGAALADLRERPNTHFEDPLHLAVSMRSFRAENVSEFVRALLDCDRLGAQQAFARLRARYPIVITRDLRAAKRWIRSQARGSERYGLLASSKAQRLKPHAVDVRVNVDPVHWFLNERTDTRSSYYLEDAATEFQVQGLELDWTCVTWDGDLRHVGGAWSYHDFRGSRWCNINKGELRNYLRNAYRVLLTRARQGMVLFVPEGDPSDPTRLPEYYDETYRYLLGLGIPEVRG